MKHLILSVSVILVSVSAVVAQTKKPAAKAPAKKIVTKQYTIGGGSGVKLSTEFDSVAYAIGMNIGKSLSGQGLQNINLDLLSKGIGDVVKAEKCALDDMTGNAILGKYFEKLQRSRQTEDAKKYEAVKLAGEAFLAENKKRKEVVATASGLQYEVMKAAEGPKPTINDKVRVHYHGTLIDGTVFDSSVNRGEPAEFPVGGVIQGWIEGLQLMPVGSKWKLFIPYNLAYGDRAAGAEIKPYSALVFEVELLDIVK